MAPAKEQLVRGTVTLAVVGALGLALYHSDYAWNFEALWAYKGLFLKGLLMTLAATAVAYAIGFPLGILVALARLSRSLPVRHLGDLYVQFFRGTPFIVQLMLIYFGISVLLGVDDKFALGTAALGMFAASYIGEIFRAGIESVERGQVEAARSLGLSRGQTMRVVVLPQAFKRMIPPLTGELIALTKESSLLFIIGISELMAVARQAGADTYNTFEAMILAAFGYLLILIPLSILSRRLESRLGTTQKAGEHL